MTGDPSDTTPATPLKEADAFRCILILATIVGLASPASSQDEDRTAQARLACLPDAIRLCPDSLLDPDQARACIKTKKALVTPACAAFYPGGKRAGEVQ